MKKRSFYLFYVLTAVLLLLGFLTKDVGVVDTTWGNTFIRGMWSFFAPYAIGAFFVAVVYHFCYGVGRPVNAGFVITHAVLVVAGLLFSYGVYRRSTVIVSPMGAETMAIEVNSVPFYMFIPAPVLLVASFVVFAVGIFRARRVAD